MKGRCSVSSAETAANRFREDPGIPSFPGCEHYPLEPPGVRFGRRPDRDQLLAFRNHPDGREQDRPEQSKQAQAYPQIDQSAFGRGCFTHPLDESTVIDEEFSGLAGAALPRSVERS